MPQEERKFTCKSCGTYVNREATRCYKCGATEPAVHSGPGGDFEAWEKKYAVRNFGALGLAVPIGLIIVIAGYVLYRYYGS